MAEFQRYSSSSSFKYSHHPLSSNQALPGIDEHFSDVEDEAQLGEDYRTMGLLNTPFEGRVEADKGV